MDEINKGIPLPGIPQDEYTKLLLSVGGTSKERRPLSPVEVGEILVKSKSAGASTKTLTAGMHMTDTSMPGKFMKLIDLDESILHLVTWGASDRKALGFSVAAQLSRVERKYHLLFAQKCLEHGITKDEAVSVIQLFQRSGQTLEECFSRVVRRRPSTRTLEVILGSVASDPTVLFALESMTQLERDQLFTRVVNSTYSNASNFSAKLGKTKFAIIGGKSVRQSLSTDSSFSEKLNHNLKKLIIAEEQP